MDKETQYKNYARSYNQQIFNIIHKNKKILDVGCNIGNLGERLIKDKNCKVYGLDYSIKAIDRASKKLTKAVVFDLESYELPFRNEKFDIILFADVLEHLRYPEEILKKYSTLLKDGGEIVASIPNISYAKNRIDHLFGRWDYKDAGILDKTHLRFFTERTVRKMFKNCRYEITKFIPVSGIGSLRKLLCMIYPRLFAIQFIIIAKIKN